MATSSAILGDSLYTSIFNPQTGDFLTGGLIYWYKEDKVTPAPVYKSPDIDPSNTWANPYELDVVAAEPPFYYDPNISPYWIEIYPAPDPACACDDIEPIYSFFYWPPQASGGSSTSTEVSNFVTNGQFAYPIPFNTPEETKGQIKDAFTEIAQAWFLETDAAETSLIYAEFDPVYISSLPGNPCNQLRLKVTSLGSAMNQLDIRQRLGFVNLLQGETVTLSIQGLTNSSSSESLKVRIFQLVNSTDSRGFLAGTLTFTNTISTQSLVFTIPPLTSGTVDPNFTWGLYLVLEFPLLKIIDISISNIQIERGNIKTPSYIEIPNDVNTARTFASDLGMPTDQITQKGAADYWPLEYFNNGFNWYTHNTGSAKAVFASKCPPDMAIADGSTLDPRAYSLSGIPYKRLFDVIGTSFGGVAAVSATSSGNVVTGTSVTGSREKTAWSAQTSGFTVTQTQQGLKFGIECVQNGQSVTATFTDKFTVNQTPPSLMGTYGVQNGSIGSYYTITTGSPKGSSAITQTTLNPGSPTDYSVVTLEFSSNNIGNYKTGVSSAFGNIFVGINFLEFSSVSNNGTRGFYASINAPRSTPIYSPMCIAFSVDGSWDNSLPQGGVSGIEQFTVVPFLTAKSLQDNIKTFCDAINNPFIWTVTVPALPAASSYFFFSSASADYYMWFTIDGVGTDPAIAGRTPKECALLSTDTTTVAATKIAQTMDEASFQLPTQADYCALGNPLNKWAIYL